MQRTFCTAPHEFNKKAATNNPLNTNVRLQSSGQHFVTDCKKVAMDLVLDLFVCMCLIEIASQQAIPSMDSQQASHWEARISCCSYLGEDPISGSSGRSPDVYVCQASCSGLCDSSSIGPHPRPKQLQHSVILMVSPNWLEYLKQRSTHRAESASRQEQTVNGC